MLISQRDTGPAIHHQHSNLVTGLLDIVKNDKLKRIYQNENVIDGKAF